jgi:WD40 repeat protein
MADYLHGVSQDQPWLKDLLAALAWAQGDGLDSPETWVALAGAVGAGTYSRGLVAQLFDTPAVDLLHRSEADGRVHYRLFHEALGEHLRAMTTRGESAAAVEDRIVRALLDGVPHRADGTRNWGAAGPYAKIYLSVHAAAGGVLDVLLDDAAFLVAAEPARLLAALPAVRTPAGRDRADLIERFGQQLLSCPAEDRASVLELAARTGGSPRLADQLLALEGESSWSVPWARWYPTEPGHVLCHHDDWVHSLATATVRGQPFVISASSWTVAVHSLTDGQPEAPVFREQVSEIYAAVAVVQDSELCAITLHADGGLRRITTAGHQHAIHTLTRDAEGEDLWLISFRGSLCAAHFTRSGSLGLTDIRDGRRCDPVVPAGVDRVLSVVNPRSDQTDALGIGTDEHGTYLAWDLESGTVIGDPLDPAEAAPGVRLRFVGAIPGSSATGNIRVLFGVSVPPPVLWEELAWSPTSNCHTRRDLPWIRSEPITVLALPDGGVCYAAAFGDLHVPAQENWPPRRIAAHNSPAQALAFAERSGHPCLISAGQDGAVRDWPLDVPARNELSLPIGRLPLSPPVDEEGSLVIPYRRDKHTISIIEVSTGRIVREIPPTSEAEIRTATIGPTEAFIVTSDAPTTVVCIAADKQRWSVDLAPDGAPILSVLFIGQQQSLLVATADGQLTLLSSATGELLQRCRSSVDRPRWTTGIARGSSIHAAGWEPVDTTGRIAITTLSPHGAQSRWVTPPDPPEPSAHFRITDARFITSGAFTYLVAVGYNGRLWIWDPDTGQMLAQDQIAATRHRSLNALCQVNTPQGPLLFCGGFQCKLLAWHPDLDEYPEIDLGVPIGDLYDAGNDSVLVATPRGTLLVRIDPDRVAAALDPLAALRRTA